jgi:hypothetical protein
MQWAAFNAERFIGLGSFGDVFGIGLFGIFASS